jgi:hypothetical protein
MGKKSGAEFSENMTPVEMDEQFKICVISIQGIHLDVETYDDPLHIARRAKVLK